MSTVVVIGGSSGIGLDVVRLALRTGHSVHATYATTRSALDAVQEGAVGTGPRLHIHRCDASDPAQVAALAREVAFQTAGVSGLVTALGTMTGRGPATTMTTADWRWTFDVNLTGVFVACREFLPVLQEGRGAIVTVSSGAALTGGGSTGSVAYAAAKAGLESLTMGLAEELRGTGVRVNGVRPGPIDTPFHRRRLSEEDAAAFLEAARARSMTGKLARPQVMAEWIMWLLSDHADFLSGRIIDLRS